MAESKFERIDDPADPRRCQGIVGGNYQCIYVSVPGSNYCIAHSANTSGRAAEARKAEWNYNLHKYRARIQQFAENPRVKSLREEVGVLRLLLETVLNKCEDETALMIYTSKISELVLKIEKVVASCHNLEAKTGQVLDKTAVINLCEAVVQVIQNYVDDPDVLAKLSGDLSMLLQSSFTDPLA
jgi:hypothetical protein